VEKHGESQDVETEEEDPSEVGDFTAGGLEISGKGSAKRKVYAS